MIEVKIDGVREIEGIEEKLSELKSLMEQKLNLREYSGNIRTVTLPMTTVKRTCMLVGLSRTEQRPIERVNEIVMSKNNTPYPASIFSKERVKSTIVALIKLRYHDLDIDLANSTMVGKILGYEMLQGRDMLLREGVIDDWLLCSSSSKVSAVNEIPRLMLRLGVYDNGIDAFMDMNGKSVSNTQTIIAGATGSGKSNLLALLMNQMREQSVESSYPVNFLFFDYKGEFSDPANSSWLLKFNTDEKAILRPIEKPLPFTPFKDFTGKTINEVNLYATTMSKALCAMGDAKISAKMDDRLAQSIIEAYKAKKFKPITFQEILDNYTKLMTDPSNADSVTSSLNQIIRANLFSETDEIDLIKDCYIIDLNPFPKEGAIAKAIVYFVISKINNIYELLPKQAQNDECVELRHFTIIDEAHYMLGFENVPLYNLIQVGRNKGLSIILATQDMSHYRSDKFDFLSNAQYPMVMKQQSQNDSILKGLFGVSGNELSQLKSEVSGLQKGEVIMKDADNVLLGIGKKWKKIKLNKVI